MIWVNIKLALGSIRAAKLRSFLTLVAIIIGVAAFITVTTTVEGFKGTIASEINNLGGNIITVVSGNLEDENGELVADPSVFAGASTLTEKDYKDIAKIESVDAVTPLSLADTSATLTRGSGKTYRGATVTGTNEDFIEVMDLELDQGEFLTEENENRSVIIVGPGIVENLFGGELILGSKLTIKGNDYTVVGSIAEYEGVLNSGPIDINNMVFMTFDNAKKLTGGAANILRIITQVPDDQDPNETVAQIEEVLLENHGGEKDFTVLTQDELLDVISSVFDQFKTLGQVLSYVMLFVSAVVIMLIMTITVSERTHEIGIRKSIGATNSNILTQFMTEAVVLSWVGSFFGLLVGYGLGFYIKAAVDITPAYTLNSIVVLIVISTLIGTISGIYPAWQAARKDPVEALRHE